MARINLTQEAYIGNVSSPEGPTDVTTKGYVDARVSTASTSAPTAPVSGALWVDTTTSPYVLKVYFNNLWEPISGGGGTSTITDGFTYLGDMFTYNGDYFSQPSGTAPTITDGYGPNATDIYTYGGNYYSQPN